MEIMSEPLKIASRGRKNSWKPRNIC